MMDWPKEAVVETMESSDLAAAYVLLRAFPGTLVSTAENLKYLISSQ